MADVALRTTPAGPRFSITEDCQMPVITVTAVVTGLPPGRAAPSTFEWVVTLVFTGGAGCAHSGGAKTSHADIHVTTTTNILMIPFTQVRGGELEVSVTVRGADGASTARTQGLQVVGTNPSVASLSAATKDRPDRFKKLIRLESNLRQFRGPNCPLFSADNYLGVGLCQITPFRTGDQVWGWRQNLESGWELWNEKATTARAYPAAFRKSSRWAALARAWNDRHAATMVSAPRSPAPAVAPSSFGGTGASVAPSGHGGPGASSRLIAIDVPGFTDEQVERDTLRGFNGWAAGLHEYRIKLSADGLPVVTLDRSGARGTAQWEWVSGVMRRAFYGAAGISPSHQGDPDYVTHVEALASF